MEECKMIKGGAFSNSIKLNKLEGAIICLESKNGNVVPVYMRTETRYCDKTQQMEKFIILSEDKPNRDNKVHE